LAFDPFEPLRRDLRRISGVLSPGRLPTTVSIQGRTFVIKYVSEKENKAGKYLAEVIVVEEDKGSVGDVSLGLDPKEEVARIEWASVALRRIGLGRAMVEAVERDLKARGYYLVELHAVPDSVGFWKARGYRPQAEDIPGEGLDMAKLL